MESMGIASRIEEIRSRLPERVRLVAVSKLNPLTAIREAAGAGQIVFGESRVQELLEKYTAMPELEWHFIGHLQTNKIKYIAPFVHLIHGVDSFKLLREINRQGMKINRVIPCLLQVYIATEETKFGLTREELEELLDHPEFQSFRHVEIQGLMGMATFTNDQSRIQDEFFHLQDTFHHVKKTRFADKSYFREISAGMSHDYPLAIKAGSTLVRIGSDIFGQRNTTPFLQSF